MTIKEIREKYAGRIYSYVEDCIVCPEHDQDTVLCNIQEFIYENLRYMVNEIRKIPHRSKGEKNEN